jgi:hypothetical protein
MKNIFFVFLIIYFPLTIFSQENSVTIDPLQSYKLGQLFFEKSLYGPAIYAQNKFIHQVHPITDNDFTLLKDDAGAMKAISGLRLDLPTGENELLTFIASKYPDPTTTPAILELGSYYYNKRWFKKAIDIYAMAHLDNLPEYDRTEASFKKGYAHFAIKEFKEAKSELAHCQEVRNVFYYPSN